MLGAYSFGSHISLPIEMLLLLKTCIFRIGSRTDFSLYMSIMCFQYFEILDIPPPLLFELADSG